jgi:hypothetical protein
MVPAMEGDTPKCHPEETLLTEAALGPYQIMNNSDKHMYKRGTELLNRQSHKIGRHFFSHAHPCNIAM